MGAERRLYLREWKMMPLLLVSTRFGPPWGCYLKGIILSYSGVNLGGFSGFGSLALAVSGTLGAAAGKTCGLTRATSRMVDSCWIATSWASSSWANDSGGTIFASVSATALAAITSASAEEVFGTEN